MRVIHVADNHLGRRQYGLVEREEDFREAFREFIDRALALRPDAVVHSGDLFEHYKPSPLDLVEAFRGLREFTDRGIPVYIVAGNHDLGPAPGGGRMSPLPLLEETLGPGLVHLGYHKPISSDGPVTVAGLPYTPRQEVGELKRALAAIGEKVAGCRGPRILVLHQAVYPAAPKNASELSESELGRLSFDYFAMGHIHDRTFWREERVRRPISYSGSTEIVEEREARSYRIRGKGFYLLEFEDGFVKIRPHTLESVRPFISLGVRAFSREELEEALSTLVENVERAGGRKRPLVKVTVEVRDPRAAEIFERRVREELEDRVLRLVILPRIAGREVEVRRAERADLGEMIEAMLEDEDAKRLARLLWRLRLEGKGREEIVREIERWYERWGP